jgi:NADH-quinone oxidoreductase subunit G
VLGDLLAAMGDGGGFFNARDAFAALAAAHPSFAGLSYDSLGLRGQPVADAERFAASAELAGVA